MIRPIVVFGAAVLLSCSLVQAQQAQQRLPAPPSPTRDPSVSRAPTVTAIITGQITSTATGLPLQRATITLTGPTPNPLTAVSDDQGEDEISGVPPGSYSMTATRAGYLTFQYRQRRPREAGRRVEVQSGERVRHVDLALTRAAVLAGHVVDELGEPFPGVRVEALEPRYINGRHLVVPAGIATTNDIGEFRITSLNPGAYLLRGSTAETWEGAGSQHEIGAYTVTYFPGSTASRAQPIPIDVGQEIGGLDFALTASRAVSVSGRLETNHSDGVAAFPIALARLERTTAGDQPFTTSHGLNARASRDGSFTFSGVAPGDYRLSATLETGESASQIVTVAETDVTGIVLAPRASTTVTGSITTDGATPLPCAGLHIVPVLVDTSTTRPLWERPRPLTVKADCTFTFDSLGGAYLFRLSGLPRGWMLRSVALNNRTITDAAIDISGGAPVTGLRVTITPQSATISGDVIDAHGAPLAACTIVVFAEDPARWSVGSRFVQSVRPDDDGRFVVRGLPSGAYLVSAQDFIADEAWEDPEFLRALAPAAVRLELQEGTTQEVSLKVEMP